MKEKPRVPADLADYVSHEMRSPLNGIKVWAQVLVNSLDANDEPTARRALHGIAECVDKQAQFLDSLISTAEKPMAGKQTQPDEQDQDRNRTAEHPQRPANEPDTMKGPGGRREEAAQDAKDKTTRRGER